MKSPERLPVHKPSIEISCGDSLQKNRSRTSVLRVTSDLYSPIGHIINQAAILEL
jgi:hypothetical protein